MAGPGDTVEIKITGDSSDLVTAMADVASRIDLLIDALSGTAQKFNETGESATKSMKKVEDSTKKAEKATDKLVKSTKKQSDATKKSTKAASENRQKLENAADAAGRADSALSSFASVLDGISPTMAKNARLAADMAGATEQMILAMTQAPAMVASVGIFIAAWEAWTYADRKQMEQMEEKREVMGKLEDAWAALHAKRSKISKSREREIAILSGAETKLFQQRQDEIANEEKTLERGKKLAKQKARQARRVEQDVLNIIEINKRMEETIENLEAQHQKELERIDVLYDLKKGEEDLAAATSARADVDERVNRMMNEHVVLFGDAANSYRVYIKEMGVFERASDDSVDKNETMRAGILLTDDAVKELTDDFIKLGGDSVVSINKSSDSAGRFESHIRTMNSIIRESTGSSEDFFKVMEDGGKIYGAINVLTKERIDFFGVENLWMDMLLEKERERQKQLEKQQAATRAWVDERKRLLESLMEEIFAAEQALRGPFDQLREAHQKEIEDLDEIIAKYEKSAKTSVTSAKLVEEAEKLKHLKTTKFIEERQKLLDEVNKQELEAAEKTQAAIDKIRTVSAGKEAETLSEALAALRMEMRERRKLLGDYAEAALDLGADQLEVDKLVAEERLQIEEEFYQKKLRLLKNFSANAKQSNIEEIESYATHAQLMLQGASEVTMAIFEHAEQMSIENRKKMFYLSQSAAMGEIAISGIVAIAKIWEEYAANPPLAAGLSVAMGAITGAQIATVAAEQPSFDIGGVIRGGVMADSPDQVGINALPGESILNRAATSRIGESGVNALNAGKGMGQEIIVVPAYRHFDRFIKDEYRKGGAFRRFFNETREYPVGQRSY